MLSQFSGSARGLAEKCREQRKAWTDDFQVRTENFITNTITFHPQDVVERLAKLVKRKQEGADRPRYHLK